MLKTLCFALIVTSTLYVESHQAQTGKDWFSSVQAEYKGGKHTAVFDKMKKQIEDTEDATIQPKLAKSSPQESQEEMPSPEEMQTLTDLMRKLELERDAQLLEVAKANPNDAISKIIFNVNNAMELSQESQEALLYFVKLEWGVEKAPNEQIAAIATESLRKKTLVFNVLTCNTNKCPDLGVQIPKDAIERDEFGYKLVTLIDLAKFQMMSTVESNADFAKKLALAQEAYPTMAARNHDLHYLVTLGNGLRLPDTEVERQVTKIITSFAEKRKQSVQGILQASATK